MSQRVATDVPATLPHLAEATTRLVAIQDLGLVFEVEMIATLQAQSETYRITLTGPDAVRAVDIFEENLT